MRRITFLIALVPLLISAQETAHDVLSKAITYHDPENIWPTLNTTLIFNGTRPDAADRKTVIKLKNDQSFMQINRNDEEEYEVDGDQVNILKGEHNAGRGLMLRNYYLYLWGLPMKLRDSSTPEITLNKDEVVDGVICKVMRVAYTKDTWYFYIDSSSGKMIQYKFYQDEEETKGELITLEDEIIVNEIKIPQKRSWYTLPEMKYLGTDVLIRANH